MICSVLLPVYDGADTLGQAIESVLSQTEGDFEFLIIDDKSQDRSAEIIRTYMQRDARIQAVFHATNMGLASTLNEGLERAQADLVVRMDQDDESLPDRIRSQVRYMGLRSDVAAAGSHVYHMARRREYDRLVRVPVEHEEIMSVLPSSNCIYHPAVILRQHAVLEVGGYRADFKNAEDYDLWLRLSRKYRLGNLDLPLLRYRFSTEGMTLGKKWQQLRYVQKAILFHNQPLLSPEEHERAVHARLEAIGKDHFFEQVALGTIEELMRLRLWRDAFKVYRQFSRQISARRSASLLGHLFRSIPSLSLLKTRPEVH